MIAELKDELEPKFEKMLQDVEDSLREDNTLQEDLYALKINIQWNICGIKGYQKFNRGDYSFKFGGELDDPDITLEISDSDTALKLLNDELESFDYRPFKRKTKILYIEKWVNIKVGDEMLRAKKFKLLLTMRYTKGVYYHPLTLTRLPIFRRIIVKWYDPETADGSYIPINDSLGTVEDKVLPLKVLEYFINKADHLLLCHNCGCRVHYQCQDHDHSIGCLYIGSDTVEVKDIFPKKVPVTSHFATKEEALKRVKDAYDNGLITVIGRLKWDAEAMGVPDTGHFMTVCFCCPCCCIVGKRMYGTIEIQKMMQRIEGVSVTVDEDLCIGCEDCMEVCTFEGMEMIDGLARINQEKCLGCGRCERVCPNKAITITLDDPKRLDEFIRRIEAKVDVS
ncbi:MAG: indolepyruvate ferredoxin oxidoreductase subunit alpha [Promethearchaeota archaeon]|jgi:UDP-glucose 4-epimerase